MRYLFLFISLFFCGLTSAQQKYVPMVQEGAHWTYRYIFEGLSDGYGYVIKGDTLIDNITYKKLYERFYFRDVEYSVPDELWNTYYSEQFLTGIREDTLTQKVFLSSSISLIEECTNPDKLLIYDFNIEIGDTLNTCILTNSYLSSIDTITTEFLYGMDRRVYSLESEASYIEGIGSTLSLFEINTVFTAVSGRYLHDYCLGTDEECQQSFDPTSSTIDISNYIRLYPNPSRGSIYIKSTNFEILDYEVINQLGEKVMSGSLNSKININHLPQGIYYLFVKSKNGQGVSKFIKMD